MPPENPSGLIETCLAAMALLQSPLISETTRGTLAQLMATLNEDIKAARAQSGEKAMAQKAGEEGI